MCCLAAFVLFVAVFVDRIDAQNACIWGRTNPTNRRINGEYIYQGIFYGSAWFFKPHNTTPMYLWREAPNQPAPQYMISPDPPHNDTHVSYFSFCNIATTVPWTCINWIVYNGTMDAIDSQVYSLEGSCPEWHCDAITTDIFNANCNGIFDIKIDRNAWSNQEGNRFWFFSEFHFSWMCSDVYGVGKKGFTSYAWSYPEWRPVNKGESVNMKFKYPNDGQYHTINCIETTVSPTFSPTLVPTFSPSLSPTFSPTLSPTVSPSQTPSQHPINSVTLRVTPSPRASSPVLTTNVIAVESSNLTVFHDTANDNTKQILMSTWQSYWLFIVLFLSIDALIFIVCLAYILTKLSKRAKEPKVGTWKDAFEEFGALEYVGIIMEIMDIITDYIFATNLILSHRLTKLGSDVAILGWGSLIFSVFGMVVFICKYALLKKLLGVQIKEYRHKLSINKGDSDKRAEIMNKIRYCKLDIDVVNLLNGAVEDGPQMLIALTVLMNIGFNLISIISITLSVLSFVMKIIGILMTKLGCKDVSDEKTEYNDVPIHEMRNMQGYHARTYTYSQ
eukprot:88775_1